MRTLFCAGAFVVVLAACGGTMSAQTTSPATETRNKATVERSFQAWRDGTGSPYDLLAETATWTIVGRSVASKTYDGREAFMRDVIRPFNARMAAPLRPQIRDLYGMREHQRDEHRLARAGHHERHRTHQWLPCCVNQHGAHQCDRRSARRPST